MRDALTRAVVGAETIGGRALIVRARKRQKDTSNQDRRARQIKAR